MMKSLIWMWAAVLAFCIGAVSPSLAQTAAGGMSVRIQQGGGAETTINLYSASYALVIGNDDYRKGWPRLSNAVRDAQAIKQALERQGYQVTLLTNLRRTELIDAMREFFIVKGEDPEARLLFWFAGHGYTENNEGFIIPVDGELPETGARFRLTALPMRDVSTFVRLAAAKHVYAVFDACFAGTIFGSSRAAPPKAITQAATRPVRQFLTSGDAYQQVSDDGTFRDLFVRALNGEEDADLNNDGYVTGTELGFYISDRMTNLTEGRQTPRYGKLRDRNYDQGDYVLASRRTTLPAQTKRVTQGAATGSQAMELALWQSAERTDSAQSYGEYLKRFPGGMFAGLAGERLRLFRETGLTTMPANEDGEVGLEVPSLALTLSAIDDKIRDRYEIGEDVQGVAIEDINPDSSAAEKGILPGDVIVQVGQEEVRSPSDVKKIVAGIEKSDRKSVLLLLNRGGDLRFVAVRLVKS